LPLARRLGPFDVTMIVMGGIIGSGIFANPSVVATRVGSATLALTGWMIGGAIALAGAFVYAELADRRPELGGQYAYLRDAFHPIAAFLYGWTLLLVIQTGGMAASAMIFGRYARDLFGIGMSEQVIAVVTLVALTIINCLGVRAGSNVQNVFMVLKLAAIAMVIVAGLAVGRAAAAAVAPPVVTPKGVGSLLPALVPIIFAYGGWQTASFVSGEIKDPRRNLAKGMLIGVVGVIVLYMLVNIVCIRVLGIDGLAATKTPASDIMRVALGENGGRLIAIGITVSTLGFLSQSMLTAPRVYHAMASDGLFFRAIAKVDSRTQAPVSAIALQGLWASVIAVTGGFDQILDYVVSVDAVFFGLTGLSLFVFRARERNESTVASEPGVRVPGHPFTTGAYVLAFWGLAISTIVNAPQNTIKGIAILAAGVPVYFVWNWIARRQRG
jgi:APA family basic amino acid/polyamine antiporter